MKLFSWHHIRGEWYPYYITGEDYVYLLLNAELAKFLYSKLENWIWNAIDNNYFYIFSYVKVYISCLLGEYLLFQKFNVKIVINVIDVVV